MIFGEHAVLRSKKAIVAAIDRFLHVELIPRADTTIYIESGKIVYETDLKVCAFPPELRFVEGVFRHYKGRYTHGFDIRISSQIPQTVGLASSASVTVALVAAFEAYFSATYDKPSILRHAVDIVRHVQGGRGSGADVASIVYGGVILFHADSLAVEELCPTLPLTLIYSGYKTPTPVVIDIVHKREQDFPHIFHELFETIELITESAAQAIVHNDLKRLGTCMNMAQGCMEALLVSTKELSSIVWNARSSPDVFGAKISGSGLGDSVVALGSLQEVHVGQHVEGTVTPLGVQIEKVYEE